MFRWSYVEEWVPVSTKFGAGGGISFAADGHVMANAQPSYTAFTLATSFTITSKGQNRALASYWDESAGSANTRVTIGYHDATTQMGVWDTANSWLYASTPLNPALNHEHRAHATYNGTVGRSLFINGIQANASVGAITSAPSTLDTLLVGREDNSNAEAMRGTVGLTYLRPNVLSADWIAAEQANLAAPAAFYTTDNYRVLLTINPGTVTSSLRDFPLMIRLSLMPYGFWNNVDSDAGNVRITVGGSPVPFDVAWIDTAINDGVIFARVNISALYHTYVVISCHSSSTDLLPVTHRFGRNAVWSDYECVYLLRNDLVDRTGHHDLTLQAGASTFSTTTLGNIGLGGGWTSDGDDRLGATVTNSSDVYTIGATGKVVLPSAGVNYSLASRNAGFGTGGGFPQRAAIGHRDSTTKWSNWDQNNSWHESTTSVVNNAVVRLHGVWNSTTYKQIFVNGVKERETGGVLSTGNTALNFYVGSGGGGTAGQLNGAVSFVYMRLGVLSEAWIAAEYLNINNPGAFYSLDGPSNPNLLAYPYGDTFDTYGTGAAGTLGDGVDDGAGWNGNWIYMDWGTQVPYGDSFDTYGTGAVGILGDGTGFEMSGTWKYG